MGKHTKKEDMTLRDWFAGMALAGIHASDTPESIISDKAKIAYLDADQMMKEREESS